MLVVPDDLFRRARIEVWQGGTTVADSEEFIHQLRFAHPSLFTLKTFAEGSHHSLCEGFASAGGQLPCQEFGFWMLDRQGHDVLSMQHGYAISKR